MNTTTEIKLISYLKYLTNEESSDSDNLERLRQESINYIRTENKIDMELFTDILTINYINRYQVIMYYMAKTNMLVRDTRMSLNEVYRSTCSKFKWYNKINVPELQERVRANLYTPYLANVDVSKLITRTEIFFGQFNRALTITVADLSDYIEYLVSEHLNSACSHLNYIRNYKPNPTESYSQLSDAIIDRYSANKSVNLNKQTELKRLKNIKSAMQSELQTLLANSEVEL